MAKRDVIGEFDTVILGAGAAGMMCAAQAAARGGRVLVLDHAKAPGEKIRISGGGRCNFTNLDVKPQRFISANPHFAKSALSRYTQHDFIALVAAHGIAYHEKTLGQLFCDESATLVIAMLVAEMERAGAQLELGASVENVAKTESGFSIRVSIEGKSRAITARNFVVACGGKSIPKMGATNYGYKLAEQFGLAVTETRAGLVPLVFGPETMAGSRELAGVACDARVSCNKTTFDEALLFTHRGLSGPAILQISSYWREGQPVEVNLAPKLNVLEALKARRKRDGRKAVGTVLADLLPKRLAAEIASATAAKGNIADMNDKALGALADAVNRWRVVPMGTEGYRTAEVTLGGVDTAGLNSRTMEARDVPGLYIIGEVVDVTGWLGGYNFQWAWSSGWAAGQAIAAASD
ncbi:NAD(P)/FAD-dependent oxidoreductase [Tepidamorphus sp. 3E244]|uniref:NAD(P)/FAD-dependent oxidoreductase n=1 Tax=Tepidamorphus sp. 3E244 TaxID=3385498 RepID=UPI0038FCF850